jgi:hypothetical protein
MAATVFDFSALLPIIRTVLALSADTLKFIHLLLRPTASIAAENLFFRKQLCMSSARSSRNALPTPFDLHSPVLGEFLKSCGPLA